MRQLNKLILAAIVLVLLISGCSMNRSIGITRDTVILRGWQDDIGTELSVKTGFIEDHSDQYPGGTTGSGTYIQYHSGSYSVPVDLSFAVMKRFYSNGPVSLSFKARLTNSMYYNYTYNNTYVNDYYGETFVYASTMNIYYLKQNSLAFIFPDAEFELPFLKGIIFNVALEMASFSVDYSGGSFTYESFRTTHNGKTTSVEDYGTVAPGSVMRTDFKTFANYLGSLQFGILYKF